LKHSDTVVLIGNGPSAGYFDLAKLGAIETVAVNHFYFSEKLLSVRPSYWLLVDPAYWTEQIVFDTVIEGIRIQKSRGLKVNIVAPPPLCALLAQLEGEVLTLTCFDIYGGQDALIRVQQSGFDVSKSFPELCQSVFTAGLMFCAGLKKAKIALIGFDFDTWYPKDEAEFVGTLDTHIYDKDCVPEAHEIKRRIGDYGEANKTMAGRDFVAHRKAMIHLEAQINFIYQVCRNFKIEIVNLNQKSLVPIIPKIADDPLFFI